MVRPAVHKVFEDVSIIIHAGDVVKEQVINVLSSIAPVYAVRGNMDKERWTEELPWARTVEAGPVRIYVLHDLHYLDIDPAAAGYHAVIHGHTHKPGISRRRGILYLNPGSSGPEGFKPTYTAALLSIKNKRLDAEIVSLKD